MISNKENYFLLKDIPSSFKNYSPLVKDTNTKKLKTLSIDQSTNSSNSSNDDLLLLLLSFILMEQDNLIQLSNMQ